MLRLPARRAARPAALLLSLGLLVPTLAACGSDDGEAGSGGSSSGALDSLEVTGEVGEGIEVAYDGKVAVEETTSEVLVEGDGEELSAGESVLAHIYVGNGETEEQALTTYEGDQPQLVPVASEGFITSVSDALEGASVGSRVAVAATPEDAFGPQGNPQIDIGTTDTVVFVVDVLAGVLPGPEGEEVDPENPVPTLVTGEGTDVTELEFPGSLPRRGDELEVSYLIRGQGAEVTAESTVAADYLGQVLGADEPFDTSYTRPTPTAFPLDGVVEGWTQGLTGVPIGSRVVLRIPPALGYGQAGNPGAGIEGTDTLFFVIDVLGATNTK